MNFSNKNLINIIKTLFKLVPFKAAPLPTLLTLLKHFLECVSRNNVELLYHIFFNLIYSLKIITF